MDGWVDGWMDGWMDGKFTEVPCSTYCPLVDGAHICSPAIRSHSCSLLRVLSPYHPHQSPLDKPVLPVLHQLVGPVVGKGEQCGQQGASLGGDGYDVAVSLAKMLVERGRRGITTPSRKTE